MGAACARRVMPEAVSEGEGVVVTDWSGNLTLHVGPCKLTYFPAEVRKATQHVATVNEYLMVHKKSGEVEVLPGPTATWQHPGTMISVAVHSATKVGEQEVIVVYRPAAPEAAGKGADEDLGASFTTPLSGQGCTFRRRRASGYMSLSGRDGTPRRAPNLIAAGSRSFASALGRLTMTSKICGPLTAPR